MTEMAKSVYKKCLHGMYDESACSICKGWPDRDKHTAVDVGELVKDTVWHGTQQPQHESTAPWNKPPVLRTAEEIWGEYSADPDNWRLSNQLHDEYVAALETESEDDDAGDVSALEILIPFDPIDEEEIDDEEV